MDKLKMQAPDLTDKNIERIASLFPNVITETKDENGNIKKAVDFDLLKQALSKNLVEGDDERYRLDWPGKKASLLKANIPITKTLRPCRDESVNFDTTENLYIEGDNFEVLKILQESYLGKVKMIYIDPPYNTGNDFIYKDDYTKSKEDYEEELGTTDEEGGKLFRNTDSNGRFHSDWLSMMYERLVVARDLLKDDGVIFISIDDNEVHNLRKICDEVFGEENFLNIISAKMKNIAGASGGGEDKRLKKNIEFILIYAKDLFGFDLFNKIYNFTEISALLETYKKENISWKYTSVLISKGEEEYSGSTKDGDGNEIKIYRRKNYEFSSISQIAKQENLSEEAVYKKYFNDIFTTAMPQSSIRQRVLEVIQKEPYCELYSIKYVPKTGRNKGVLYEQFYKGDKLRLFSWFKDVAELIDDKVYKKDLIGTLWDKIDLNNLTKEGDMSFENGKKPLELIRKFVEMSSVSPNDIILDFFSGSATTAHAVMQLNAEDGRNRKFIMVQLPEKTDENSEAYKEGYKTITEIGKERIRRAGKKILEDLATKNTKKHEKKDDKLNLFDETEKENFRDLSCFSWQKDLDIGFRVYKTDESNMKDVFYHPSELKQGQLEFVQSNIKEDRTPEDLLTQVILDLGLELSLPIETKKIGKNTVFIVQTTALVACFDNDIDFKIVDTIAGLKPFKVVFKDASFKDDKDRINVEERFKRLSPVTKVTVI